jgi:hypothetical protein
MLVECQNIDMRRDRCYREKEEKGRREDGRNKWLEEVTAGSTRRNRLEERVTGESPLEKNSQEEL